MKNCKCRPCRENKVRQTPNIIGSISTVVDGNQFQQMMAIAVNTVVVKGRGKTAVLAK